MDQSAVSEGSLSPGQVADDCEHSVDSRHVSLQRISSWLVTAVVSSVSMVGLLIAGVVSRPSLIITLSIFALWVVVCSALAVLGLAGDLAGVVETSLRRRSRRTSTPSVSR